MNYLFRSNLGGLLQMSSELAHHPVRQDSETLRLLWNRGTAVQATVDNTEYHVPAGAVLALLHRQEVRCTRPEDWLLWSFNRGFYCVIDHDAEVGCAGFLFYGSSKVPILEPGDRGQRSLELLSGVFAEEFETRDSIQEEMLRMLLKRLIIKLTRWGREQIGAEAEGMEFDLYRRFNLLVEQHFAQSHKVAEYADRLNRSPKTLSNLFARLGLPGPQARIHQRIAEEAERMLRSGAYSVKEAAYALGFEDPSHFSRFVQKQLGKAPSELSKAD